MVVGPPGGVCTADDIGLVGFLGSQIRGNPKFEVKKGPAKTAGPVCSSQLVIETKMRLVRHGAAVAAGLGYMLEGSDLELLGGAITRSGGCTGITARASGDLDFMANVRG